VSDTPHPPLREPIGLALTRTSRAVSRAFDARLAEAGGTLPVWLVLLNLTTRRVANQRELAEAVGIQGATLTHHLNGMESTGLLTRRRDPDNRRVHVVELTAAGRELFLRLREAAVEHDQRIRAGFSDEDLAVLGELLSRMQRNVAGHVPPAGIPIGDGAAGAGG
jgi:MarR family transcriptional regulator, transcriptional regulator for hemolysin